MTPAEHAPSFAPAFTHSQREAARRLGISHTALQKALLAGRIAPEPGGGWDVEKLRAQLAASSAPDRKTAGMAPQPQASSVPASRPMLSAAVPVSAEPPGAGAAASFHGARTANEVLKAQERRLRLDERRGRLVDRARALALVHRLAREERDALMALPARVAAEMASELGVDPHQVQLLLEARLRQHLAERANVRVRVE